jgi:hypothetical protein
VTVARKLKRVNYQLVAADEEPGLSMYGLLRELVTAHHPHLEDARIALAWNSSWKRNVDGRLTLGKCRRASDLDRELAEFDFVIVLLRSFYEDADVTDLQRRALLDHELCHADVKLGPDGDPAVDERGRTVYRIRKHDLEEFSAIAERYGTWKRDIESFAIALRRGRESRPLLEAAAGDMDLLAALQGDPEGGIQAIEVAEKIALIARATGETPFQVFDRYCQAAGIAHSTIVQPGPVIDTLMDNLRRVARGQVSSEAAEAFVHRMQRQAQQNGASVTVTSGGRRVTVDADGAHAS